MRNQRFNGSKKRKEQEETALSLRQQPNESSRCCCWKSKSSANDNTVTTPPTPSRQPSKWKAIKIVLFTTGAFVVTWVPYFVASTIFVYCDQEKNPKFCNSLKIAIASPLAILGFTNSLLNPIIYAWWHNGFRTNSVQIFTKRFGQINCCRRCFNKSERNVDSSGTTNLSSSPTASSEIYSNNNVKIVSDESDCQPKNISD